MDLTRRAEKKIPWLRSYSGCRKSRIAEILNPLSPGSFSTAHASGVNEIKPPGTQGPFPGIIDPNSRCGGNVAFFNMPQPLTELHRTFQLMQAYAVCTPVYSQGAGQAAGAPPYSLMPLYKSATAGHFSLALQRLHRPNEDGVRYALRTEGIRPISADTSEPA